MKLSKRTIAILKNFASINQQIIVKPGNTLQTISNVKDVFAKVEIEETFPREFAIYDLNEFLGVIGLFEDPDLDFQDTSVVISSGKQKQTYYYADASIITAPPESGVNLPSVEITASLTKEQISTLVRAVSVNSATDLTFTNGSVKAHDSSVPNSNSFVIDEIGSHAVDYSLSIGVDKIKFITDDYNINICAKGLAQFVGTQGVEYAVALQPNGTYAG